MIFKYKTITVQKWVELDIDLIRAHQSSIIRTANILPNGNLIHDETIDDSLISLEAETLAEERLLLGEISQNNFYYDETRNKYLGLDTEVVTFYIDGTNKKKQYMYQIPGITSSSVPYKLFSNYCLIAAEGYTLTSVPNNTNVMQVRDIANGASTIMTFGNTSGVSASSFFNDTLDVTINSGSSLGVYILNFGMDAPAIKLFLKQIYNPTGA